MSSVSFDLVLSIVFATIFIVVISLRKIRKPAKPSLSNAPVLFSNCFASGEDLIQGNVGQTPKEMHFEYYIGGLSLFSDNQTTGVFAFELPFNSNLHLLGIAKNGNTPIVVNTTTSVMEPVDLEGDYSTYFSLYADKNQQAQSRYVLDPAAMVFTIDFCSQFNWEIIEDTLYIMSSGRLPPFDLVDRFVDELRPAIEDPSDRRKNHYRMSYTDMRGRKFNCPVCQRQLVQGDAWLACPSGHGCLLTGGQLLKARKSGAKMPEEVLPKTVVEHGLLTCPYCSSQMVSSQYQQSNITIDVCSKCMYRWLDSGEPSQILRRSTYRTSSTLVSTVACS